jgi:hypothetical protein
MSFLKSVKKIFISLMPAILLSVFFIFPFSSSSAAPDTGSKKLANYYLSWALTEQTARELSKWDLVILDMEIQKRHPDLLLKMRQWNPDIILLVYITSQDIRQDALTGYSVMRQEYSRGISENWYLKNTAGQKQTWWPGTYLLNVSNKAPKSGGISFNDYLVDFVAKKLLSTGYWDGVFYDNAWDNITYFLNHSNLDLNNDSVVDSNIDEEWKAGMKKIFSETRRLAGDNVIIIGNGTTLLFNKELDGQMFENFSDFQWEEIMKWYKSSLSEKKSYVVINANEKNVQRDSRDFKSMRYSYASALMEDGYYSYDFGDKEHGQLWWFDEYNINLGKASGLSASRSRYAEYKSDVWTRSFDRGMAVVNSTNENQNIDLGADYEKIHGTQDPTVNDGMIASDVEVGARDGIILLKPMDSIEDAVYANGDFVRFVRPDGSSVRNGFFIFNEQYGGGDSISKIDLTGDGKKDLVVVSKNKLIVYRDDGELYLNTFPYSVNYKGKIFFAVGDIDGNSKKEIVVFGSKGYKVPIKVYSHDGILLRDNWFPFGKDYTGGYSIAVAKLSGEEYASIIVGSGAAGEPIISIYNNNYSPVRSWRVFEKTFRGGVKVAAGDINGDGISEIISGPGAGKSPVIKIFDAFGKLLYKEFTAYSSLIKNGVSGLGAVDVDFDGVEDILVFSG